jgi:hypothetical protein
MNKKAPDGGSTEERGSDAEPEDDASPQPTQGGGKATGERQAAVNRDVDPPA